MATKILIVRTSSLGDLVHMLPAISDIAAHVPDAQIDWLAEEAFAEIPSWHPAVHEVIAVSHRRWRKSWWSNQVRQERQVLKEKLHARHYDIVLDMQALMKSIWLVRMTTGRRHGLDFRSAREPMASLFYDVRHQVKFWQPAVTRQRLLAAATFGYVYEGKPDFGLQQFERQGGSNRAQDAPYAVIMPSASREDKLWPVDDWHAVFERLLAAGLSLKVLAGNEAETRRAQDLIASYSSALVLPKMGLRDVAQCLAGSTCMVGLDSGLTHLSAALGRPTIGIYKASTPIRTPLVGDAFTASLGDRGRAPKRQEVLDALSQLLG